MENAIQNWYVIINPTSGNGSAKKKWPKIKTLLTQYNFEFEFAYTEFDKHSKELAQKAIKNGFKNIICIGGDGTLHNIVNGIFNQSFSNPSDITIGIIPIGTGNDWIKTHNIPKHIESSIKIIKKGFIANQDLGKIEFQNYNGSPVFFNNSAGVGFDGYVVSYVNKYKYLGALSYLIGAIACMFSFKNFNATINTNEFSVKTLMITIGLCKYSGGGMQLTNNPSPFDGLFDISMVNNFHSIDIIKNIISLFNGKIDRIEKVKCFKTRGIKIEFDIDNLPLIQADGELVGSGDFKITLLPKALAFYTSKSL